MFKAVAESNTVNSRRLPVKCRAESTGDFLSTASHSLPSIPSTVRFTSFVLIGATTANCRTRLKRSIPKPRNLVVWVKTNGGMGTFYRSQHELIFVFKNGQAKHLNNFELGQHGRSRTNVWSYAGLSAFRAGRLDDLSVHPTVKPVALVADALRDCSRRGDIVLDPFVGSGTSIIAAERVGRRAFGLEIDPLYVDVAVRRWQAYSGRDATLRGTGQTFDDAAAVRIKTGRRHD